MVSVSFHVDYLLVLNSNLFKVQRVRLTPPLLILLYSPEKSPRANCSPFLAFRILKYGISYSKCPPLALWGQHFTEEDGGIAFFILWGMCSYTNWNTGGPCLITINLEIVQFCKDAKQVILMTNPQSSSRCSTLQSVDHHLQPFPAFHK